MTKISARCPSGCGTVWLTRDDVVMVASSSAVALRFECPLCMLTHDKPLQRDTIEKLARAGVLLRAGEPGRTYPESKPGGPSITYDDVLEFHFELETDAWRWWK